MSLIGLELHMLTGASKIKIRSSNAFASSDSSYTDLDYKMGPRLRESRLLAPCGGRPRVHST